MLNDQSPRSRVLKMQLTNNNNYYYLFDVIDECEEKINKMFETKMRNREYNFLQMILKMKSQLSTNYIFDNAILYIHMCI